jgi:hypothetical protein
MQGFFISSTGSNKLTNSVCKLYLHTIQPLWITWWVVPLDDIKQKLEHFLDSAVYCFNFQHIIHINPEERRLLKLYLGCGQDRRILKNVFEDDLCLILNDILGRLFFKRAMNKGFSKWIRKKHILSFVGVSLHFELSLSLYREI